MVNWMPFGADTLVIHAQLPVGLCRRRRRGKKDLFRYGVVPTAGASTDPNRSVAPVPRRAPVWLAAETGSPERREREDLDDDAIKPIIPNQPRHNPGVRGEDTFEPLAPPAPLFGNDWTPRRIRFSARLETQDGSFASKRAC